MPNFNDQLITDASVGNLAGCIADIAGGANVNYQQTSAGGITALETAAINGWVSICQYLVSVGANVNLNDTVRNKSPLMGAAFNSPITPGADECVQYFVTVTGINLDNQGVNGFTAINDAAFVGGLNAVYVLARAGANIHIPNGLGNTPLQSAQIALTNCFITHTGPCPVTANPPNSTCSQAEFQLLVNYLTSIGG